MVACHREQVAPQSPDARTNGAPGSGAEASNTCTANIAGFFGLAWDGLLHRSGADGRGVGKRADKLAGCKFGAGDIVTCVVDLEAGLLVFLINGKPCKNVSAASARSAGGRVARTKLLHILGLVTEGGGGGAVSRGGVGGPDSGEAAGGEGGGEEPTDGEDDGLSAAERKQLVELAGAAVNLPDGAYLS